MIANLWKKIKNVTTLTMVMVTVTNLFAMPSDVYAREQIVGEIYNIATYEKSTRESNGEKAHVIVSFPVDNLQYQQSYMGDVRIWNGLIPRDEPYLTGSISSNDFKENIGDKIGEILSRNNMLYGGMSRYFYERILPMYGEKN